MPLLAALKPFKECHHDPYFLSTAARASCRQVSEQHLPRSRGGPSSCSHAVWQSPLLGRATSHEKTGGAPPQGGSAMNICSPKSNVCGLPPSSFDAPGRMPHEPPTPASNHLGRSEQHSRKERDDNYFAVVAMLAPRWRVILCKSGTQFILQRHFVETLHRGVWRANSFHVSSDSLMRACVTLDLFSDPKMEQLLADLPATAHECAALRAQK
jgi:hypothetical protein